MNAISKQKPPSAILPGSQPVASPHPDLELLVLSETFCILQDMWLAMFPGGGNEIKDDNERGIAQEPYWQQQQAIAKRMNEIRATTYEGAAARARAVVKWAPDLVEPEDHCPHEFHETIVAALLRDLIGEVRV
jgi:hypothetical protein